ncbi:MAG: hypothetical protein EP330_16145 [Deltaproteobacteria bacterium]|nr:MAG: hypothetical protein EP330_16145 [Deltaproteobacteria bacterium]
MIAICTDPLDDEVVRYLVDSYPHLLSPVERSALRAVRAAARSSEGGGAARLLELWTNAAPEARELTAGGVAPCMRRLAERLWREHAEDIAFNTCPHCGGLAKSPSTKLCHHCWYDWH